jgi:chemotaxis protein CheD
VTITIPPSDARTSANPDDVLATHSLAACMGVCLYDPQAKIAGMLHYQLPSASIDPMKARQQPFMFADTGMTLLLAEMESLGAQKRRIRVKLAGAAAGADTATTNAGKRNHAAIRKILWQHGMFIESEEVGGPSPRTVFLSVADGELTVKLEAAAAQVA